MTSDVKQKSAAKFEARLDDPRYLYFLFVALVFMLLVVPLTPLFKSAALGGNLMQVGLTAVLITAAIASRRHRGAFYVSIFIVLVATPLTWSTRIYDNRLLIIASCLVEAAFFVSMGALILVAVIKRHMASFHSIFGAICSYLLLGLAWAMLYLGLLQIDPTTFKGFAGQSVAQFERADRDVNELSDMIYYSFVTMSTLGYGDITPQNAMARTLSWMQSVTGQFYLAVLVAWLVTEIPRRRREEGIE